MDVSKSVFTLYSHPDWLPLQCQPLIGGIMTRFVKAVAVLLVLMGGLVFGGTTAYGQTPVSGTTQLWGNVGSGKGFNAIFTGTIGDHGVSIPATSQGKPSKKQNTGYRLFVMKKGTIFFNTQQVDAAENNNNTQPTTENNTTCSFTFVVTEPATIISGTKAYAGITGSISVTISYAAVLPLTNGKCNPNTNANPTAQEGFVTGSGTVSYG